MTEPPTHTHADLAIFTRKVGPLPGWAYLAIAAGLFVAYKYWRNRTTSSATDTAGADVPSTDTSPADSPDSVDGGLGAGSVVTGIDGTSTTSTTTPTTNADWGRQAIIALSNTGLNEGSVENAIDQFLNGGTLTAAQQAIVVKALNILGPPPEGALPLIAAPTTTKTTTSTTTPTTQKTVRYTTRKGDTLASIAERYYGSSADAPRIRSENPVKLFNYPLPSSVLPAGILLYIPVASGGTLAQTPTRVGGTTLPPAR